MSSAKYEHDEKCAHRQRGSCNMPLCLPLSTLVASSLWPRVTWLDDMQACVTVCDGTPFGIPAARPASRAMFWFFACHYSSNIMLQNQVQKWEGEEAIIRSCVDAGVAHVHLTAGAYAEDHNHLLDDRPHEDVFDGFWADACFGK